MDSGFQVTLVSAELLTLIEQRKGWTTDKWKERDYELKTHELLVLSWEQKLLYHFTPLLSKRERKLLSPFFVLKSSKPVWQGMVHDCAMVLGTNAMVKYGLRTVHSDGAVVPPISPAESTGNTNEYMVRRVLLGEKVHLAPGMSRWVKVKVEQSTESSPEELGVITPEESILASQSCDFVESLWCGEASTSVVLNNWGKEALSLQKDQQVGIIVPSCVVAQEDPVWEEEFTAQVWLCEAEGTEAAATRREQLQQ